MALSAPLPRPAHPLPRLFLFGLLFLGCSRQRQEDDEPETVPSAEAPPAPRPAAEMPAAAVDDEESLRLVSGQELLEAVRASNSRAVVVNAWASWCGPCRREFPMLARLKSELKKRDVAVLFVSVDEPDGYPAALEFAQEHGQSPPLLVARRPLGPFKQALHPGWPGMLPATFLYDGTGRLRYFWGGPVYEEELMPVVEGLLRGDPIDGEQRFGLQPGRDYRD